MALADSRGVDDAALAQLVEYCRKALGPPEAWVLDGAHPDALALCILDALWSPDGQSDAADTAEVLALYAEMREEEWGEAATDGARELMTQFELLGGPAYFAERVKKHLPISSSRKSVLSAGAVSEACELLVGAELTTTAEVREAPAKVLQELERAWKRIAGQRSGESFHRMLRLAGCPTLTPNRHLVAFVGEALGTEPSPEEASAVVTAAAAELDVPAQLLAHRIRSGA